MRRQAESCAASMKPTTTASPTQNASPTQMKMITTATSLSRCSDRPRSTQHEPVWYGLYGPILAVPESTVMRVTPSTGFVLRVSDAAPVSPLLPGTRHRHPEAAYRTHV